MKNYSDVRVLCPFFVAYNKDRRVLCCNDETGGVRSISTNFNKQYNAELRYREKCCNDWRKCPIARLLWGEYEQKENFGRVE